MASITPDPQAIIAFKSEAAFEAWLEKNHLKRKEVYLRIYKKGSGVPTVSYAQALDVALCWGWIDGVKLSYDTESFLQRFTPRAAKGLWSQMNRQHVDRLIAAGRMKPQGQRQVDAAKADGRWDAAYASPSKMEVPADLVAAIEADPRALATFQSLNKVNRYALAHRLTTLKTAEGRAKRIQAFVEMLQRGETLYPNTAAAKAGAKAKDVEKSRGGAPRQTSKASAKDTKPAPAARSRRKG